MLPPDSLFALGLLPSIAFDTAAHHGAHSLCFCGEETDRVGSARVARPQALAIQGS